MVLMCVDEWLLLVYSWIEYNEGNATVDFREEWASNLRTEGGRELLYCDYQGCYLL